MFTRVIRSRCPHGIVDERGRARGSKASALLAVVLASLGASAMTAGVCQASRSPVLRAHGEVLKWSRAGRHNRYKLLMQAEGRKGTTMDDVAAAEERRASDAQPAAPAARPPLSVA